MHFGAGFARGHLGEATPAAADFEDAITGARADAAQDAPVFGFLRLRQRT